MATDPVCGMQVEDENAVLQVEYNGKTFHFCSSECQEVFQTDPEPYAKAAA